MNPKYFILSSLIHIIIFIGFSNLYNVQKIKNNGIQSPNIHVNLTMSTTGNSNKNLTKITTKKKSDIVKKTKTQQIQNRFKKKLKKEAVIKPTKPKDQIIKNNIKSITILKKYTSNNNEMIQIAPTNNGILEKQKNDENLVKIQNGEYALKNQKISGINIIIHKEILPTYPELALKMGYRKETIVKVKFLVDKKGHVRKIDFYTKSKYGFEEEVEKALKQWMFEPIIYHDQPMPIYFYKVFHFVSKV